jgi:hypothetical protein
MRLPKALWAHKAWTVIAILGVIAIIQLLFLGVGLGSSDSGIEIGPITTQP